jgi:hypothetical protein
VINRSRCEAKARLEIFGFEIRHLIDDLIGSKTGGE